MRCGHAGVRVNSTRVPLLDRIRIPLKVEPDRDEFRNELKNQEREDFHEVKGKRNFRVKVGLDPGSEMLHVQFLGEGESTDLCVLEKSSG